VPWPRGVRFYDEEIKAPRIGACAKLDGIERTPLAEKAVCSFDFCRRLERQRRQIGGSVKAFRR
jgi:hypothetical protein